MQRILALALVGVLTLPYAGATHTSQDDAFSGADASDLFGTGTLLPMDASGAPVGAQGRLVPGEDTVDAYAFDLAKGASFTLDVTPQAMQDIRLILKRPDGSIFNEDSAPEAGAEHITIVNAAPGRYELGIVLKEPGTPFARSIDRFHSALLNDSADLGEGPAQGFPAQIQTFVADARRDALRFTREAPDEATRHPACLPSLFGEVCTGLPVPLPDEVCVGRLCADDEGGVCLNDICVPADALALVCDVAPGLCQIGCGRTCEGPPVPPCPVGCFELPPPPICTGDCSFPGPPGCGTACAPALPGPTLLCPAGCVPDVPDPGVICALTCVSLPLGATAPPPVGPPPAPKAATPNNTGSQTYVLGVRCMPLCTATS